MAIINLPIIDKAFYKESDLKDLKAITGKIKSQYGNIITNVSRLTNVPEELIIAMIFIESRGNTKAVSSRATGLMQLDYTSAGDIIFFENKNKRLSLPEKEIITKYIGKSKIDCILKMKYMGDRIACNNFKGYVLTQKDLYNPELNILIGAIYLGILIDDHTQNGVIRLDQLVLRYNKGFFTKFNKSDSVSKIYANASSISQDYIKKLAGQNSVLSQLV